eukprot:523899_1
MTRIEYSPTQINKLRKMFADSLLIQGYCNRIINKNHCFTSFCFDDVYGIICEFYDHTSLYNAVCAQDQTICDYLCKHGIVYNITPLRRAIEIGNIELVNIILPHTIYSNYFLYDVTHVRKCDVVAPNNVLMSICIDKIMDNVDRNKYMDIIMVLLEANLSPNTVSEKHNASLLHCGCKTNDFEFIRLLTT